MVVGCEVVWREVSNYLDGEVDPALRAAMDEHFATCKKCASVLQGTRNVIQLYGDERMIEVPLGFGRRLERRLEENTVGSRRSFLGWLVAAAAAVVVVGGIEVSRLTVSKGFGLRSQLAQPANRIPPDLKVVVAEDGKLFHLQGCPFIHEKVKLRTLEAREAIREGYTPCVRCLKQYLQAAVPSRGHPHEELARVLNEPPPGW